jgi:hypothetical protein
MWLVLAFLLAIASFMLALSCAAVGAVVLLLSIIAAALTVFVSLIDSIFWRGMASKKVPKKAPMQKPHIG